MKKLSVVIPAYNEEATIKNVIRGINYALGDLRPEIIVVNDCSTDKTGRIASRMGAKVIKNNVNIGHARSVMRGLMAAKGEYILYMDADDQIRADSFRRNSFNYEYMSGYRINRQDKFFRKAVSLILRLVILLRYGYNIKDANCPFKGIRRGDLMLLIPYLPPNPIVPTIDLAILARRHLWSFYQYPVFHHPYIKERKGKLQSINPDSLELFWNALKEVISL